jgi:hypothetical protein
MIGFDRSAFAGRPKPSGRQSKCESRQVGIHNEGLPEHPTKKLGQTSVTPSVVLSTRRNPTKRFSSNASLQLLCIDSFGKRGTLLPRMSACTPNFLDRLWQIQQYYRYRFGFSEGTGVQGQSGRVGAAHDPLTLREWLASMYATGHTIGAFASPKYK